MKECKSKGCGGILAFIGAIVLVVSAVTLIIVYRDKVSGFISAVKSFFSELSHNCCSCSCTPAEGTTAYTEYENADIQDDETADFEDL